MNVLFVSMAFPPKNDPECLQTARYFKYLSREEDLHIDVVTSSIPTLFMPEDESLKPLDKGYRSKVEIPVYETKLTNYMLRKAGFEKLMFPDSKMTFHWQWKRVVKKLKYKPDVIYSRSHPISSAFMAKKLRDYYQIPWVHHFSDPWALSPLSSSPSPEKLETEKSLIEAATKITFTTIETLQHYAGHYPLYAHKFSVTPNVFDAEDVSVAERSSGSKLKLVYTGGLAGQRTLFFLDDVLQQIENINPAMLDKLEIKVAGQMDRYNAAYFDRTKFKNITHIGEVAFADAKKLQQSADVLLVVDNPTNPSGAVFFPSKLLDYFLTGIKIMAVTPKASVTSNILKDYPSVCFEHQQIEAMADFLVNEIHDLSNGSQSPREGKPPVQFSAAQNALNLAGILRSVAKH